MGGGTSGCPLNTQIHHTEFDPGLFRSLGTVTCEQIRGHFRNNTSVSYAFLLSEMHMEILKLFKFHLK
jgi:hypothetical protein